MPSLLKQREDADALGRELWDYFRTGEGREVIERDDGYLDPSDVAPKMYFAPLEDWPEVERRGIRYARGRVLDVGCGAGRVGIYLQGEKKLRVTGIDVSPLAVKVSRLRGLRDARLLPLEKIDFGRGSLDTVVMYGNNFGLLGSMSRAKRLLRRLHRMTSDDAVIICDSVDPYKTDNLCHLRYHAMNRKRGRMAGQVRIRVRYLGYVGRWFDYLLVSPQEMREVASGTGWDLAEVLKSDEGPLYVGILRKQ
jgi:SAM-dependent methyltransferase